MIITILILVLLIWAYLVGQSRGLALGPQVLTEGAGGLLGHGRKDIKNH